MKLRIAALGRMKSGPERELVDTYADRCTATGRPIGLGPLVETEIDNRAFKTAGEESRALAASLEPGARLILLDERGRVLTSRDFAGTLGRWRDEGAREAVFCIGGADGHDRTQLPRPDLMLAFGPAVWPHKLVRVMLAEQLYRAVSILAGSPYHRD
ncbi:23S rRNA (pseudouridine(1915)-N(3))-methyltransferase RlmH [Maricaulis sp.]|uniref:23S rRNA (pseudouridine(1915)-N(3))-methyltransferase RlmH n=1 Tax=Maricaulis sp. TaxID=1486257 RepID=UPI002604891A|nr:23S rRNA (pseudouridine(1915)-N(3))-methyltransferase RlmH [Maricaulis sp.]